MISLKPRKPEVARPASLNSKGNRRGMYAHKRGEDNWHFKGPVTAICALTVQRRKLGVI